MASKIASGLVHASRWLRRRLEHVERLLQSGDQVGCGSRAASQMRGGHELVSGFTPFAGEHDARCEFNLNGAIHDAKQGCNVEVYNRGAAIGQSWNSMKEGGQAAMSPWFHPDGRFYNPWK